MWGIYTGISLAQKKPEQLGRRMKGWEQVEKRVVQGNNPHEGYGYVCEEVWLCIEVRRVGHWMLEIKLLFSRWLCPCLLSCDVIVST
jgi:hypothetical protein